jgi:Zn-dependent protease with chaperone function
MAYPPLRAARFNAIACPALLGGMAYALTGPLCPVRPQLVGILAGFAAWVATVLIGWNVQRTISKPQVIPIRQLLRNTLASVLVLYPVLFILALVILLVVGSSRPWAWTMIGIAALAIAFVALGGGFILARIFGLAKPPSVRLRAIMERAATWVGVRPRAIYELCLLQANALAVPLGGQVAVTTPALATLDDEELSAVCTHELGHLAEPRRLALARALPAFLLLLPLAGWVIYPVIGLVPFVGIVLAIFIALILFVRLSRRLENRADRFALVHEEQEGVYARALAKLHEANLSPVVYPNWGRTHPHLYDRLMAAGVPPAYPRPKAPPSGRLETALGPLVVWIAASVPITFYQSGVLRLGSGEPALLCAVAIKGRAPDWGRLALARYQQKDYSAAAAFYRAAAAVDPVSPNYSASCAITLTMLGRCNEAEDAVHETAQRCAASNGVGWEALQAALDATAPCRQEKLSRLPDR